MANNYKSYKKEALRELSETEKRALEKIGFFIEAEQALRSPVETGTLRRSLSHVVDSNEKAVHNGTNVEYAIYPEKGTSKQPAQHFMENAVMDNIEKIKDIVEDEFKKLK